GYAEYTIPDVGAPAFGAAPAWLRTGRVRDVAMSDWSSNALVVSKSNGAGSFVKQSFQITSGYFQPFGVAAGRVNDDNTVDVAVVCQSGQEGDGGLVLEMNYGSDPLQFAEYAYPLDPTIHDKPCFVEIGDLNRDTRNDIAVTANSSYRLYVWLNNLPPPPTDGN
ncbi:MAG TPA: hypothetical protein VNI78_13215, partial [Vicinamibacterales bacterium]|nr:hypothetical protein [Vicinamibacterales bacterium]